MPDDAQEPKELPTNLPPWVSAHYDSDGILYIVDQFQANMRWPGVRVESWAFKALSPSERLYQQSRAFLHAAKVLCEDAGEIGHDLDWPQANVCYYCLHLATELFLKACLELIDKEPNKKNHEIADLLKRYRSLLPSDEFQWPTPWSLSAKDLNQFFGYEAYTGVDRTPDQLYRYGSDKSGTASAGIQSFTPGYLFNYMGYLEDRWSGIWIRISSSHKL